MNYKIRRNFAPQKEIHLTGVRGYVPLSTSYAADQLWEQGMVSNGMYLVGLLGLLQPLAVEFGKTIFGQKVETKVGLGVYRTGSSRG